jgi:hypothetical protein
MNSTLAGRIQELTADISLRPGSNTTSDASAFARLFNGTYARRIPGGYYTWQFFETPFPSCCFFAEHQGRIVGCGGIRLYPLASPIGHSVGLLVDSIIAPDWRRGGLFPRLELELERWAISRNAGALYAFPNRAGYSPRVSYLGWRPLEARVSHEAETQPFDPSDSRISFQQVSTFDCGADDVWSGFTSWHPGLAAVRRDARFLNWRFAMNPWHQYDLFEVGWESRLFGYLVLKVFVDPVTGASSGDIVDILWKHDAAEALCPMLGFALGHFWKLGARRANVWLQTNTLLDEVAKEAGFRETNSKRFFCCRVTDSEFQSFANSQQLFVTMADSEIF